MTSRLQVRHVSRYLYEHPVNASFNEARLIPMSLPWQRRLEADLHVEQATWHHNYVDYWGTEVRVFEALRTHRELVVEARSVVELDMSLLPKPSLDLSWAELRGGDVRERFGEYLQQTDATSPDLELALQAAFNVNISGHIAA